MVAESSESPIVRLMHEHERVLSILPPSEISLRNDVQIAFSKTLLLSVASYFEVRMSEAVVATLFGGLDPADPRVEFVRNKAVERRFHDWFDWKANNANQFFGAFGSEFRTHMVERVREDDGLREGVRAFLQLGNLRNQLVHQNYAAFSLDLTVEDIFALYEKALEFVESFPSELRDYLKPSPA